MWQGQAEVTWAMGVHRVSTLPNIGHQGRLPKGRDIWAETTQLFSIVYQQGPLKTRCCSVLVYFDQDLLFIVPCQGPYIWLSLEAKGDFDGRNSITGAQKFVIYLRVNWGSGTCHFPPIYKVRLRNTWLDQYNHLRAV